MLVMNDFSTLIKNAAFSAFLSTETEKECLWQKRRAPGELCDYNSVPFSGGQTKKDTTLASSIHLVWDRRLPLAPPGQRAAACSVAWLCDSGQVSCTVFNFCFTFS